MKRTLLIIGILMTTCGSLLEGFSTFESGKISPFHRFFSKNNVLPDFFIIGFDPDLVCRWQMFLAGQVFHSSLNCCYRQC